jgi:hypothetical protein
MRWKNFASSLKGTKKHRKSFAAHHAMMRLLTLPRLAFNLEELKYQVRRTATHWKNFASSFKTHKKSTERALPCPMQ